VEAAANGSWLAIVISPPPSFLRPASREAFSVMPITIGAFPLLCRSRKEREEHCKLPAWSQWVMINHYG
jgi:hypothetical protein